MVYGDTISFTLDFNANRALVGEYLLWDIMAQIECPTGHAVLPLPDTEALRVPSAKEIVAAQIFGHRIEDTARRLHPRVDFSPSYDFSDKVVAAGRAIFHRAMEGLKEAGADIRNPLQLLYVLKNIGPVVFEETFSIGNRKQFNLYDELVAPTDVHLMSQRCVDENSHFFTRPEIKASFNNRRLLVASTDVHQNAIGILDQLLTLAGACVINLGAEKDPDEIISRAKIEGVDAILVSTHNGNALQYAQCLRAELDKANLNIPVIMGGRLNQKVEHEPLPVDVRKDLKALGFFPCSQLDQPLHRLIDSGRDAS
jgi:methylmalonyl-CoA mutase cobalamin-binding subunit